MEGLEYLKKEIEKSFQLKFEQFEASALSEHNREIAAIKESHAKEIARARAELEKEEKKAYKEELSSQMLAAKKEYEEKRESIIRKVFAQAEEKVGQVILSDEYIAAIKSQLPGKLTGGEALKTIFPEMAVDNSIKGVVIKKGDLILDFSYLKFVDSKRQELRHLVSKVLYGV